MHIRDSDSLQAGSTLRANQVGAGAAFLTAGMSVVTFIFSFTAYPITGPFCLENCIEYPYLDTFKQYPHDFRWMPMAVLLVHAYLVMMAAVHASAPEGMKIFSLSGFGFALLSAGLLASDYFIQFTVVPASLFYQEADGLALLTQYNPHGLFIALEELGYLLMSLSFLSAAFAFSPNQRIERLLRWTFLAAFGLTWGALVYFMIALGLGRAYLFEVAAISANWLALLVGGLLLGVVFIRRLRNPGGY